MLKFSNIENNVATIKLYGTFGFDIIGKEVADEITYLNETNPFLDRIEIKINSYGGDVNDGLSICTEILDSQIPVHTIGVGMVYSIAGVVLMCGKKRYMRDYATFMMHDASGGSDEEVLDLISNSLAVLFNKSTSISIESIRDLMQKETWMSPDECLKQNLIDEIITTEIQKPLLTNKVELIQFYNKLLTEKKQTKNMEKLANHFKLNKDASEEGNMNAIQSLEVEVDTYKADNDALAKENLDLKSKVEVFENKAKEEEAAKRIEVINKAHEDGKIDKDGVDKWTNTELDSEALTNLFDTISGKPVHVSVISNVMEDERKDWKYDDWIKNDPDGLANLEKSAPEQFKKIVNTMKKVQI